MESRLSPRVLWLLSTCCFTSMASMRVCDSLLPSFQSSFDVTTGGAAQTISAFALAYGVMQLFFGPLGDRFGKVRVIALATLACTIGNVGAAISLHLDQLVVARVLSGAAAAGIVPLTMAWIGDMVPYDRRQEVLARLLGATVFGMIAGQWLGGLVADTFNWRVSFASLAAISLLAGLLVSRENGQRAANSTSTGKGFGHRAVEVLSIPWARTILLVTFIEGALAFSTLSFIPSYLHTAFNIPMSKAGGIVALYGVGGLLYSRCARLLVRRLGEANLARLGGACLAASYGGLASLNDWPLAIPACLLAGFGFYALHNTLQTHATQMAPGARGTAVSLFSCFLFFGQSLGVLCAAWFLDRFSAPPVFLFSATGLLILALTFSMLLSRQNSRLVQTTDVSAR
ncbi:MFS transporter [Paraburkholderia hospita]|uniref:MFS transporter n=1 Tax=Paraburkholderia hospita TaxID=169430 RepID=UPI000271BEC7|nr:MFS transporter [Paraburkholderia hospita]EUC16518.1 major facilitator superfamily MFS_1 [Burkholderia sp. BT03]SKC77682.1 Predicted arabinose efflux permease, MFS family [Paraburkholderia hospita]